ncbi:MAG: DMT family transporter [Anaerolineae bacterium]|nr:DMT family transporter [Anaerolineae bacterium]
MRNSSGKLAMYVTLFIWGTTFVTSKMVLQNMAPLQLTFIRFLIGFLLLAPFAARQGFRLRQVFEWKYLLFGLTGTTLYYALQNVGMTFTSVSSTSLILASVPALTTLLAVIFLKERLERRQVLGIALVTIGVALISLNDFLRPGSASGSNPRLGNLLILCSALAWAVYTIQGRRMNDVPALVATAAGMGAGALLLIPFMGWEIAARGLTLDVGWMTWLGVLYLSVAASGLTSFLWNYTLHYFSASEASAYINLVPIIAVATGIFYGERPPLVQILGGALAIAGVLLSSAPRGASKKVAGILIKN